MEKKSKRSSSVSPPPPKRRKSVGATKRSGLSTDVQVGHLTVYSWNINGIGPFVQRPITSFCKPSPGSSTPPAQEASSLRDVLRRQDWPSILCLQEVKIREDDESTKTTVERSVMSADGNAEPSYKTFFCLPCDKYNARGFGRKIYGVCTLIRTDFFDKVVNNVRTVDWDAEGRFLVCETRVSGMMPRLAIINVYAVNGTEAPYKDPQTGEPAGTRHDRKLQVHKRLQTECRALEEKGFACIVAGDLNIARKPIDGHPNLRTFPKRHCLNRADFEARFFRNSQQGGTAAAADDQALDFIDTFRQVHGESRPGYTYYPRGKPFGSSCDRVDMILISQSLKASLQAAGICETPADRSSSDHVPLWCTLGFEGE
ncbi:DNase I [Lecanosticta acicola]|uniref:DNase I n=1 Tax=Lecanosticta acicola TaxID=111012 RepID=A0AAI9EBJ7_9PEZI|nr:DNase I [Lecanosticta acicola]